MHEGQLAVSAGVVRGLVADQFPGWRGLEVRAQLEAEAAAGRELAGRTPFGTPEPVALGEPGAGYPLPWSVQTWLARSEGLLAATARSWPG